MKRIFIFILMLACLPAVHAQMAPDADTLGNIWIVTIDDSGSMLNVKANPWPGNGDFARPAALAARVRDKMKKHEVYDRIDYEHDRFIFYRSGYSYSEAVGLPKSLASAPSLDTSFIHHTDAILHRLAGRDELISRVHDLMSKGRYAHDLSFVSQIRTFSVVKTLNFLKERGELKNFHRLKLITITDDADQNDQWRVDYRILALADKVTKGRKPISQSVRETIRHYVYNDLTGEGAGVFTPVFSDDASIPHIWVYEYDTKGAICDTLRSRVLRVAACDGKTVTFRPAMRDFRGDSVCFYSVDSIVFNGVSSVLNESFDRRLQSSLTYRNGLRFNRIKVYGSVQLAYEDEIYGPHYRKVRFVQEQALPSGFWAVVFAVLGFMAGGAAAGFILYRLVILPRRRIVKIYSGNGRTVTLCRGFRHQWKNEDVPVVRYDVDNGGIKDMIVRKCSNVTSGADGYAGQGRDVLLCSRTRLIVSETALEHSSLEDLDNDYAFQAGNYPALLRQAYRSTAVSRVRAVFHDSSNPLVRWLCRSAVSFLNSWCRVYYYYFRDLSEFDAIRVESPDLLADKVFLVEMQQVSGNGAHTLEDYLVEKAVSVYYKDSEGKGYDALLCYDVCGGKEYWNIVLLDYPAARNKTFKTVYVIYRYVKDVDEANMLVNRKRLLSYARKATKRRYSIGLLDCSGVQSIEPARFDIVSVPVPGFISMVEFKAKPRAQLLYSPFTDGFIGSKYVSLKTKYADGHLYLSFLPYRYVKPDSDVNDPSDAQMLRKLSDEIVRTNDWTSGKMVFEQDVVMYRGITADLKF